MNLFWWKDFIRRWLIAGLIIFFIFLSIALVSGGYILTPKEKIPEQLSTQLPEVTPSHVITVSQPAIHPVVTESESDYMYRTSGRYLGENFGWRRDDVAGLKDMIVNVSVYDYEFMPSYRWWSVSWGRYFYQPAPSGMKYLFVFVRMELEGEDQNKDPRVYGFPSKYYGVQYRGRLWLEDGDHQKGVRIAEMAARQTVQGTEPFDYGWIRTFETGWETSTQQESIRMGKSNSWDGYILYTVPVEAQAKDILITADFQGLGGVAYWKLLSRPS